MPNKLKDEEKKIHGMVTCDRHVWKESEKILHDVGLSRSRFLELVLREVVRSKKVSFADLTGEIFEGIANAAVKKAMKEHKR